MSHHKDWSTKSDDEKEYAKKMYRLWELKYSRARAKGKDQEAETAKKRLDYWLNQI